MEQVNKKTGRIQELIDGIHQRSGKQNLLYKELITLTSADELGGQYTELDFNVYFQEGELTTEEQVCIINKGYYREFANLVGLSKLPVNKDIDTCRLLEGMLHYIDCKLIPWIEEDLYQENCEYYSFYDEVVREFTALNELYLGKDDRLGDLNKKVKMLIGGLHLQTDK